MYLDGGTSLFETLATITAEEASRPVSAACASLAAQVEHVRFYLDVVDDYLLNQEPSKVDWRKSGGPSARSRRRNGKRARRG